MKVIVLCKKVGYTKETLNTFSDYVGDALKCGRLVVVVGGGGCPHLLWRAGMSVDSMFSQNSKDVHVSLSLTGTPLMLWDAAIP